MTSAKIRQHYLLGEKKKQQQETAQRGVPCLRARELPMSSPRLQTHSQGATASLSNSGQPASSQRPD